jgi:hypothetical protein
MMAGRVVAHVTHIALGLEPAAVGQGAALKLRQDAGPLKAGAPMILRP